jgi:hypothetical protein
VARYNNGIPNGTNQTVKMALDSVGNIYVTGVSRNTNSQLGYVAIKYTPNGSQLWASRYDSTSYPLATPTAFAVDSGKDVVVTGSAGTIMYDTNGVQLWLTPFGGKALAIDNDGNPVLTGISFVNGLSTDVETMKFDADSGDNIWYVTYPSSFEPAVGQQVLVASDNSIYVCGSYTYTCTDGDSYEALLVVKYNENGGQMWTTLNTQGGVQLGRCLSRALPLTNRTIFTSRRLSLGSRGG